MDKINQLNASIVINELFTIAENSLGQSIINAFVPLGGFKNMDDSRVITDAFDHEMSEIVPFIQDFQEVFNDPNSDIRRQCRLLLLIYCRIMEYDFQYLIIYNLLRLLLNQIPDWRFRVIRNGKEEVCETPSSKIDEICSLCNKLAPKPGIGMYLKLLWKPDIRNSFNHSQYYIDPNGAFVNTRLYSPTADRKPAKPVYAFQEIKEISDSSILFFDEFFKKKCHVIKPFKTGNPILLQQGSKIVWDLSNKCWYFSNESIII